MKKNILIFILATFVIEIFLLLKLKFTAWPEMILWPYLNINGWQLYKDIAIAHTPFLILKLDAFYKVFGIGMLQLKIFTWILIFLLNGIVYFISSKLFERKKAAAALTIFIFWQLFYDGNGLWFDLFMGLFTFAAYYFATVKRYFWVGIFWALAFVSKQTAIWFAIPIGIEIFRDHNIRLKDLGLLITGGGIVFTIFGSYLGLSGTFSYFYNWAVKFGIFFLPSAQGQVQLPDLKNLAIAAFPFLIFVPWVLTKKKNPTLILWALAGSMGAYPRFDYFHFQPAIPFLAIASAQVLTSSWHKRSLIKAIIPIYVIGSLYFFSGFIVRNYGEGTRFYEKEVQEVSKYIKESTNKGDYIFVMNWWDNIYAYSDTLPATDPWVPQLSWYQTLPGIQEKEVADLILNKPKLIVLNEYSATGLSSYIPQKVNDYVRENYTPKEKIGGASILIPKQ